MADNVSKIVVKREDELIDVVRKVVENSSEKFLITFVEDSEMLISSINLRVLLDTADEKGSLLILQIPNNPTGVRNAKLADIPVIDTPNSPTTEDWDKAEIGFKERIDKLSKKKEQLPKEYESENITSFEERINSVLDKSKKERTGEKNTEEDEVNDMVIDKDIELEENKEEDLTKVDFKQVPDPIRKTTKEKDSFFAGIFANLGRLKNVFKKDKKKPESTNISNNSDKKAKIKKMIPKIAIPLVLVLLLAGFIYYSFAPNVTITLFVESKPVEVEKTFAGNENINEVDFENLEIPIKTETETKSISDTVTATGTAFKGEKATGSVTISYINPDGCTDADEPISLSEGQGIEADGKKFLLTGSVNITCNNYSVVGAEASEVGEEYNLASGKYFSVNGYQSSQVYGVNSGAFTGGSKEQYTVLSQQDVNKKVEELKKTVTEDTISSLKDSGDGWEIIEDTINSKVKEGSIRTSVSIGAEASTADVSLEVEATATFYYTTGVDEGLNALLTEAAINQNLFDDSEGLNLTLTEDIEKELIVDGEGSDIRIKLVAASAVEPSVNEEDISKKLSSYKWGEGIEYLENLSFISEDPVIVFTPENFPTSLRYFPRRSGRIIIEVKSTEVEDI